MSEFKAQCGCVIHVAQWTSKRKIASVKYCPLHKSVTFIGPVLDAWEQVPNDLIFDPGYVNLHHALSNLSKAVMGN